MPAAPGVTGMLVQPLGHRPPLRSHVAVPAVLVGQHHLHQLRPGRGKAVQGARQRHELPGAQPQRLVRPLRGRLPPERLADQQQATRGQGRPHQGDGAGQPPADPGRPDAGDRVERLRLHAERAGVGPHEPDPVGHAQVSGPDPRRRHEDLADVHPQPADPVPLRPGAEHLALPAAQVEQAHVTPPPAQLPEKLQLLVGERVQDPVTRLGYLVLAQGIHGAPSVAGTALLRGAVPTFLL